MALTDKLTDIADAIRDKTGTTNKYNLVEMAETIGTSGLARINLNGLYNKIKFNKNQNGGNNL